MLEKVNLKKIMMKEEYKAIAGQLKPRLSALQQQMKEAKVPVIILFEGWSAAGKGSKISDVILNLDPRGFKVYSTVDPDETEARHPFLWRFWQKLPIAGEFSIFDRSWYQEVSTARLENALPKKELARRIEEINHFERTLTDNGYLIIKFFLHISQKEQKKRLSALEESKATRWRVTKTDWKRNRRYDDLYQIYDEMLEQTDTPCAPWHVIASEDRNVAMADIYQTLVKEIGRAIAQRPERDAQAAAYQGGIPASRFPLVETPKLCDIDLNRTLEPTTYKEELKKCQAKLKKLHGLLYKEQIPVIVAYEGWDAAGKGGNIKRVAAALDPRGYEVVPIAAPSKEELGRHFLWRFWTRLPKRGHITIFDRTWYGRVMVERVEGFCTPADWARAYDEINEFEKELTDWGAVIVKFWLQIDKDEQLRRFEDRQNTPEKRWKITDEDWRNREKWDQHEAAVNDMLQFTSTDFAPWTVVESNDKKFARIKALQTLIAAIENRLK
ncbi:polyphosphate:AMP phosphotransferase [Bittarella massiliensis (ex Durand et al. 2017)]|uniref:Polyphosphate:AMP phosphotransferase n=1 Tax=Bittarella massiliensis (ex Durand et al. 2017) TaxID=1720313 RepID=A0AAW5KFW5_9FIRM|nr:polyphosphate:AMP phosphotransferase [Bittarella massiliensis (ex Durand et al. 2017)]MCQ4948844.1 polyphosphate:AMP phosphotransferase [Bittarella massiliensis (ex Durand et al. 2017)]